MNFTAIILTGIFLQKNFYMRVEAKLPWPLNHWNDQVMLHRKEKSTLDDKNWRVNILKVQKIDIKEPKSLDG
jgi:hypothetical protein